MTFTKLTGILLMCSCLFSCGKKAEERAAQEDKSASQIQSLSLSLQTSKTEVRKTVEANDVEATLQILKESPGTNVNYFYGDGETLLNIAIQNDYAELQSVLIKAGADILKPNAKGETPLIIAAKKGSLDTIKRLFEQPITLNVDAQDNEGNSALHWATLNGHESVALYLIEKGANSFAINKEGTQIFNLAQKNELEAVVTELSPKTKAYWASSNKNYYKDLLIQGDYESLVTLFGTFNNVVQGYEDVNPLVVILRKENEDKILDLATLLLDNKANVNGPGETSGTTPLIEAIKFGHRGMIKILLTRRADPNIADNEGKTPLIYAIEMNDTNLILNLIYYGAHVKYVSFQEGSKYSYNACALAKRVGVDPEVRRLLRGCRRGSPIKPE